MSGVLEFSILAGSVALGSMLGGILLFQKVDRVPEVAVPWGIAAGLIVLAMAAFGARGFEMVARLPWLGMVPDLLLVAAAGYHLLGRCAHRDPAATAVGGHSGSRGGAGDVLRTVDPAS
jgi:hypothetical protein